MTENTTAQSKALLTLGFEDCSGYQRGL